MNTTFTFRTDDNLKTQANAIFKELGLDLSTALNMFLRATVAKKRFPMSVDDYEITINPKDTYPDYFFDLFGSGKDLGLEVPEDELAKPEDFTI